MKTIELEVKKPWKLRLKIRATMLALGAYYTVKSNMSHEQKIEMLDYYLNEARGLTLTEYFLYFRHLVLNSCRDIFNNYEAPPVKLENTFHKDFDHKFDAQLAAVIEEEEKKQGVI